MKKVLLLVSILCLSSSAFSQQKRINYTYYEMDAGPESLIQVALTAQLNARLYDSDNFQKYRDGNPDAQADLEVKVTKQLTYFKPPKKQHWFLVLDNGGQRFSVGGIVRLFSLVEEIPSNPPINGYLVVDSLDQSFSATGAVRVLSLVKVLPAQAPQ